MKNKNNKVSSHRYSKNNDINSLIPISGTHAVRSLFKELPDFSPIKAVERLSLKKDLEPKFHDIVSIAQQKNIAIEFSENPITAWVSLKKDIGNQESQLPEFIDICRPKVIAVFDGLTDPHNVGASIRSLHCAGIHTIILPRNDSAPLNSTVMKTSSGTMALSNIFSVNNLSRALNLFKENGYWIYGADCGEDNNIVDIFTSKLTFPMVLVMGSEGNGMKKKTKEHCDFLINIPMYGKIDSLNVSVASGIIAFEIANQIRKNQ